MNELYIIKGTDIETKRACFILSIRNEQGKEFESIRVEKIIVQDEAQELIIRAKEQSADEQLRCRNCNMRFKTAYEYTNPLTHPCMRMPERQTSPPEWTTHIDPCDGCEEDEDCTGCEHFFS